MDWQAENVKIWANTRSFLENDNFKNKRDGVKSRKYWKFFSNLLKLFTFGLKFLGAYRKAYDKALNVKTNIIELEYNNLPEQFDGFKILHLTDLHIDIAPNVDKKIIEAITDLDYDICLMTGDYRNSEYGSFKAIKKPLTNLVNHIKAKEGIIATLGNHDTYLMVDFFESIGIKVLPNQTIDIVRGNRKISITGVDDVHSYYTDQAVMALEQEINNFKIAMVHSPEIFDIAADNNYSLYLCGHTHAGQICLPKGKPLITHLYNGKEYYKGLWKYKQMYGYTSNGCGTSGIPIRINTQSEVTLFELKLKK